MDAKFDVFLSYNRQDKGNVYTIAQALKDLGLRVWLDEWELQPGRPWMQEAEAALDRSRALAFLVGPSGIGPWQDREMRTVLENHVYNKNVSVIPVRLPGASDDLTLPGFLRQNTWVIFRNAADGDALGRLYWGITGTKLEPEKPAEAAPHLAPAAEGQRIEEALTRLSTFLQSGNVTYYIGAGACCGGQGMLPRTSEITRQLLMDLGLIDAQYAHLLPPIDVASLYYALKHGSVGLEDKVAELMMARANAPAILGTLAGLLHVVAKRPRRRVRRRVPQLIVTTNLDVLTERVFLRAGLAFSRLVQHKSGTAIEVNTYDRVSCATDGSIHVNAADAAPTVVPANDIDALDDAIRTTGQRRVEQRGTANAGSGLHSLSLDSLTEPIVYKFHGSLDIPDSCAISTEQYLDFFWRVQTQKVVPAQIADVIANSPALFLGYRLLDPDFRLIYHALLREPFQISLEMDLRYALQIVPQHDDPYNQVEARLWTNLKTMALKQMGIVVLEESGDAFLEEIRKRVERTSQGP